MASDDLWLKLELAASAYDDAPWIKSLTEFTGSKTDLSLKGKNILTIK
jgi:hypothetical protein